MNQGHFKPVEGSVQIKFIEDLSLELCILFSKYFVLEQLDGWVEYSNHGLNGCSLQ